MAFDRSRGEIQREVDDIQGDVLVGLQKDQQVFVSFEITDPPAFKSFLRLLSRVTTMRVALEREFIVETQKAAGSTDVFTFVGTTIGITAEGLRSLGASGVDMIEDGSFKAGLIASSPALNDPEEGRWSSDGWLVGGRGQPLHGLLTVTGPLMPEGSTATDHVAKQVDLVKALAGASWRVPREEQGRTREDARGARALRRQGRRVPAGGAQAVSFDEFDKNSYAIAPPFAGGWREAFNSDAYEAFPNPAPAGNFGHVEASGPPLDGFAASASITLPRNGALGLTRSG